MIGSYFLGPRQPVKDRILIGKNQTVQTRAGNSSPHEYSRKFFGAKYMAAKLKIKPSVILRLKMGQYLFTCPSIAFSQTFFCIFRGR